MRYPASLKAWICSASRLRCGKSSLTSIAYWSANRNEAAISDVTAGEVYSCFSPQCSDLSRISFGVDDLLT
jgi:hypothetical protein